MRIIDSEHEVGDISEDPLRKSDERRVEAIEELKMVNLTGEGEGEEKMTKIGTIMSTPYGKCLIQFLRENKEYPEWLANVVLVPKSSEKWHLCIDFMDLNKVCPKDPFPLPGIDVLVDSTFECEMLSFLDAYQGYNQIPLAPEDQEKTSFVIDQGVFCYNVMPFGLKNAGATYQRLVNHMFRDQIG
ncbi:UNVERIFIED_CONTAM: Polyprotein P3 [Sesamum radiatum]|uniref:Polyprotein P3 n=1 Tax=Sesamum radiatum TaxID=300843 RepID=A0AAW2KUA3_SESRA